MEKTLKPKVAMIVNLLPDKRHHGGVSHQVHDFAQHLSETFDITIFSINNTNLDSEYNNVPVCIPRFLNRNRFCSILLFPVFVRFHDMREFDILHTHGDDYCFFFTKKPIVRTFYGSAIGEFKTASSVQRKIHQFFRYFTEFISGYHAKINVSISLSTKKYLPFVEKVIPCGIDLEKFKPGKEKSENPSILFVGTIKGRKRGWFLSKVFREEIRPKIPNAELWIVSGQEVKGEGIKWFGRIPEDELIEKYQKAWIFCLPSTYEGFGVPYIEAMACGTTAVATPNPGSIEVLSSGEYGIIAEDMSLGKALVILLTNNDIREKYIKVGFKRAKEFSWSNIVSQYTDIYEKLIKNSKV